MTNLASMSKKKQNTRDSRKPRNLRAEVLDVFKQQPHKPLNYKQVASSMGVYDDQVRTLIMTVIEELAEAEKLDSAGRGKYVWNQPADKGIEGTIEITKFGRGFVLVDGQEKDIPIAKGDTGTALYGDRVEVVYSSFRKKRTARVQRVISRAKDQFVCIFDQKRNVTFGLPTDQRTHIDFFIPPAYGLDAKHGEKVVVELLGWDDPRENPVGKVVEVLGMPGDNDVEMHSIMIEYGLPYHFPSEVLYDADRIPKQITSKDIASRRDFRDVLTFTIDPYDAKDFDDALSLKQLENGNWEIGVHIADVSHYLRPGTILEEEALKRATSVYLVDRTIPMLPEVLSNELCSLRPNEDKLCFSAVFEMNNDSVVLNSWFGRTVIHSDRRFTYEEAQEMIEGAEGDHKEAILTLDDLAKKLRAKRFKAGGIDFNTEEVKFKLDEMGKPVGVFIKRMKDANKLIEDFMLLANVKVAERVGRPQVGKPSMFVYRIHDLPDIEKLKNLREFAGRFGYEMPKPNKENAESSIRELVSKIEGTPEQDVIKNMAIRSMAKAEYSTHNIGHYGFAFDFYTHFTSPIRRYPDVMVHRLLQHYLDGGASLGAEEYDKKCRHSSEREKKAAEAERASIKYKQVEFLMTRIGETFKGILSGVTARGLYVEIIENKCEGMVSLDSLYDDDYYYDEAKLCLRGRSTGKEYHFGDEIVVTVSGANLQKRQLDFKIADVYSV